MKSYSTHIDYIFQVKRIKAILQDWRTDEDSQFECVTGRGELIVSRNYRMPIYRTFQIIEENIVSNLQYRVFRYSQNQWFILSLFAKNSPKILKIRQKFLKKKVFFEALISYREKNPNIVSILYRVEKKLIAQGCM